MPNYPTNVLVDVCVKILISFSSCTFYSKCGTALAHLHPCYRTSLGAIEGIKGVKSQKSASSHSNSADSLKRKLVEPIESI